MQVPWNHCTVSSQPHCREGFNVTHGFLLEPPGPSCWSSCLHITGGGVSRSCPAAPVLPHRNENTSSWGWWRMMRAMNEASEPCGDDTRAVSKGDVGCKAAAAPFRQLVASQAHSETYWHWGTPTDFYQLWLTSLASGSCLFIYNVMHIRGSLPGKIRQLISSLKEAI